MSDSIAIGLIVILGFLIAASAAKLRIAKPWTYWTASIGRIVAITIALVFGGRGSQVRDVVAAACLVVAFPVLVTFSVARQTTSGLWLSIALAAAAWLTALFVGVAFGINSGLIPK